MSGLEEEEEEDKEGLHCKGSLHSKAARSAFIERPLTNRSFEAQMFIL